MEIKRDSRLRGGLTEKDYKEIDEEYEKRHQEFEEEWAKASEKRVAQVERRYYYLLKQFSIKGIKEPAGFGYIGKALDKVKLGTGKIDTKKALKLLEKAEFKLANESCPKDLKRTSVLEDNQEDSVENAR